MKTTRILAILVLVLVVGLPAGIANAATANQAPIADSGLSRYAAADPVTLDGAGSYDPDDLGPLTFMWTQVSGVPVVITDANTATPTVSGFTQTDVIQQCEFELVVSDGELTSPPDTVKVIIVPDFGIRKLQLENPPFDPNKPTIMPFRGGDCVTGNIGRFWSASAWNSRANVISFPYGYWPDSSYELWRTYYQYGDMIIVYLSSVAPEYKQPIQTIGHSTGGQPAIDVGIHLNRVYRDARYAVNQVTHLDANPACRVMEHWPPQQPLQAWDVYLEFVELFLTSSVDGEQCWLDVYYGTRAYEPEWRAYMPCPTGDFLLVYLTVDHNPVRYWYRNSLTGEDMNKFNDGVVGGAYWSVIGPGKNLQLAPTDAYYFRWDGGEQIGVMSFYDEPNSPGRLPEPVTLVGPVDVGDPNGAVLTCEKSENAIGYQLLFGRDPYRMTYLFSDTPDPPDVVVTTFPFPETYWTIRAYDQYGSTIYADPVFLYTENIQTQTIENLTNTKQYGSIQEAINDAHAGDEIVVSPGACQYLENINFKGKNLTVRSTDPNDPAVVSATVINGGHRRSVVTFSGGEDESCVLAGFTITGGIVGISCRDASVTIRNCTIESNGPNSIEFWYGYEPIIIDCTILGQIKENAPRLIAHWKLDETEGAIASDSANDNDGNVYGDPVWQPDGGMVDGALQLDGIDDYVSTPFVLKPADRSFRVFAWIKGGTPGEVVLSQIGGVDWLLADPSEGKLMTKLLRSTSGRFASPPLISEFVITDGDWHRIGFVWDGSYRTLNVDGAEVAKDTQTQGKLIGAYGGLNIGAGSTLDAGSFFSGLIDDVRIYDRAILP